MEGATYLFALTEVLKNFLNFVIDTINKQLDLLSYNSVSNRACNLKSASYYELLSNLLIVLHSVQLLLLLLLDIVTNVKLFLLLCYPNGNCFYDI